MPANLLQGGHFYRQKVIIHMEVSQDTRERVNIPTLSQNSVGFLMNTNGHDLEFYAIHKKNVLTAVLGVFPPSTPAVGH